MQYWEQAFYKYILIKNDLKRKIWPIPRDQQIVFILSLPYSGSTLLAEILSDSPVVSATNTLHTREGQRLPELIDHMFVKERWTTELQIDWQRVKKVWYRHWDITRPILLEKSPAHMMRVEEIIREFDPLFIQLDRDPYALAESLIRKNGWSPQKSADYLIHKISIRNSNQKLLAGRLLPLTYESLTTDLDQNFKAIESFLTQLGTLPRKSRYRAHNFKDRYLNITNLNDEKLRMLSKEQWTTLYDMFAKSKGVFDLYGYDISLANYDQYM